MLGHCGGSKAWLPCLPLGELWRAISALECPQRRIGPQLHLHWLSASPSHIPAFFILLQAYLLRVPPNEYFACGSHLRVCVLGIWPDTVDTVSGRRNETLQWDLEAGSFTGVAGNEDSIPGGRVVSRGREHTLAACAGRGPRPPCHLQLVCCAAFSAHAHGCLEGWSHMTC